MRPVGAARAGVFGRHREPLERCRLTGSRVTTIGEAAASGSASSTSTVTVCPIDASCWRRQAARTRAPNPNARDRAPPTTAAALTDRAKAFR